MHSQCGEMFFLLPNFPSPKKLCRTWWKVGQLMKGQLTRKASIVIFGIFVSARLWFDTPGKKWNLHISLKNDNDSADRVPKGTVADSFFRLLRRLINFPLFFLGCCLDPTFPSTHDDDCYSNCSRWAAVNFQKGNIHVCVCVSRRPASTWHYLC